MKKIICLLLIVISCVSMISCNLGDYIDEFEFELNENGTSYALVKYNETSSSAKSDVIIPDTYEGLPVTKISTGAFTGNSKLKSVSIPDTVKELGGSVFLNCHNLASVNIPESIDKINDFVFQGCTSLTIFKTSHAVDIGWETFKDCVNLKTVVLGVDTENGNCIIGKYAFENCKNLETVELGSCYIEIDEDAFSHCENLTTVSFTKSIKDVKSMAFAYCENLNDIYFSGTNEEWEQINFWPWWNKDCGELSIHCN